MTLSTWDQIYLKISVKLTHMQNLSFSACYVYPSFSLSFCAWFFALVHDYWNVTVLISILINAFYLNTNLFNPSLLVTFLIMMIIISIHETSRTQLFTISSFIIFTRSLMVKLSSRISERSKLICSSRATTRTLLLWLPLFEKSKEVPIFRLKRG